MCNNSFERELPDGYRVLKYINAKKASFGIVFNLIAIIVISALITVSMTVLYSCVEMPEFENVATEFLIGYAVGIVLMIGYIVLHELTHGAAYKKLTGEKLTFGMSWSCAFCGVPHIYVYRRCAIIAAAAPLILFTLILIPIMAACLVIAASSVSLFSVAIVLYIAISIVFSMHIGGCVGDIYLLMLLTFKYRDRTVLVRDTGPEQFICLRDASGTNE